MRDADWAQLLKALALLLAGGGFVWWQLRDVAKAQRDARSHTAAADSNDSISEPSAPPPKD